MVLPCCSSNMERWTELASTGRWVDNFLNWKQEDVCVCVCVNYRKGTSGNRNEGLGKMRQGGGKANSRKHHWTGW